MKFTKLIFAIAVVVVATWILGLLFKLAAWLIHGLLYIAAVIVIIGLIAAFIESRKPKA